MNALFQYLKRVSESHLGSVLSVVLGVGLAIGLTELKNCGVDVPSITLTEQQQISQSSLCALGRSYCDADEGTDRTQVCAAVARWCPASPESVDDPVQVDVPEPESLRDQGVPSPAESEE